MPNPNKSDFPSKEERQALMEQLEKLEQDGIAPETKEIYKEYIQKLKGLNTLEEQYSLAEGEFGVPPTIEKEDKEKLLNAMYEAAVAGETFLAEAQRKGANLNSGIPDVVGRIQGMLSIDHDALNLYDAEKTPMSFPEIQETARTQVVDFRGKKIDVMTNKLSGRIPMTVVGADGVRRRGVFTKASYVSVKQDFENMINKALEYYDRPEVRSALAPYKTALMREGAFPGKTADEVTTDMVVEKLKEPIKNILPKYRDYLSKKGTKLYGKNPEDVSEEQLIGFLYNDVMSGTAENKGVPNPEETLNKFGIDIMRQPEEVTEVIKEGMIRGTKEKLSDTVNARDLGLKDGDRVDNRNSAMSAMAGLIGMNDRCARSVNMKYLDEDGNEVEGTFMEFADGLDLCGKGSAKLFTHVCDEPFGTPCKVNRSLADLQILDYLSGNVDRHGGNMTYKVDKNGKITDIVAFDNDTSFGVQPIDKNKGAFRLGGLNQLKVISGPMARKISGISPEMLKFTLRGRGLSEDEIEASCQRLSDLKKAIQNGKQAKTPEDIKSAGKQLCIVEPQDLEKIPFDVLAEGKHTLFQNVKQHVNAYMKKAREKYLFDPDAPMPDAKQLEEVSTTDRKYAAGGIGLSMDDMSRMLKNEVTGFEVSGLSKFMRSSGKWRSMISAVETAEKIAKQVKQEIGKDLENVPRDDPRVKAQLEKADKAMEQVRKANDAYLARKMKEKNVKTPEDLVGKGKHDYEQKRIDYALKLRKSIQKYEAISKPVTKEDKAKKEAVTGSLKYAAARKKKQDPRQPELP